MHIQSLNNYYQLTREIREDFLFHVIKLGHPHGRHTANYKYKIYVQLLKKYRAYSFSKGTINKE